MMLALGLPGLTPLFALTTTPEQKLPACCRRAGIHHCTSPSTDSSQSDAVRLSATPSHCPSYPDALPTASHGVFAISILTLVNRDLPKAAVILPIGNTSRPDATRITRTTRGPPALSL
jgi:hypothetical protein